jgi:signal transduction histidine kinase
MRYVVAVSAVVVAAAVSMLVDPSGTASTVFLGAVMVSAWWGGLGPGLVTTALAVFVLDIATGGARIWHPAAQVVDRLIAFSAVAVLISALTAARRRAAAERAVLLRREQAARATAEAANRAKDEFVAVVAHELRTPLTALLSWSVALGTGRLDPAARARALEAIEENARLQARVIDDLLDITRVAVGKVTLEMASVDLAAVIDSALDAVRTPAMAKGLAMHAAVTPGLWVAGDAMRLRQVVGNLLSNATRFTPAGGRIELASGRRGGQAFIEVADTGTGIPGDLLPHVFERFRQAVSTTCSPGLGLGLAIVRQLVELHGGTVTAANRSDGPGAVFTVVLPLAAAEDPSPASSGLHRAVVDRRNVL